MARAHDEHLFPCTNASARGGSRICYRHKVDDRVSTDLDLYRDRLDEL